MKPLSLISLLAASLVIGLLAPAQAQDPLGLPTPPVQRVGKDPRILALKNKVAKYPTYAAYQELADIYLAAGNYEETARAYSSEAALFRRFGLVDAAIATEIKAARYRTECRIFLNRKETAAEARSSYSGALLEPPSGTYVGAYIDLDDQLKDSWVDAQGRIHRRPQEFQKVVGKTHGTYFMYIGYGQPAPLEWLMECKRAGVIPHLAYEPKDLNAVQDDTYLREFAKACGKLNWPIFLRYASEMNGSWTPWHGSPDLYREKFRIIHNVFRQYAPMVATIWCVNSVPTLNIDDYYPGDDYCDWVGINVYSVPFYGNDLKRPGTMDAAPSYIKPIYEKYSSRKPIAICEFGASYMADADKVDRTDFAVSRMSLLYDSLPRFFPCIKMISWFNVNTIRHGSPSAPNNYSMSENASLLDAYKQVISSPYYMDAAQSLKFAQAKPIAPGVVQPPDYDVPNLVALGETISGQAIVSLWIRTPVEKAQVFLAVNKKLVYSGTGDGVHDITLDTSTLGVGRKRVRVYVYDAQGSFITTAATSMTIPGARERFAPLQSSGTVKRYYVDRTGSVSAVDIETLGALERIHFNPASAQEIMEKYPVFGDITAWVLARNRTALDTDYANVTRGWNLVGFGDAEPIDASGVFWPTDVERLGAAPTVKRGVQLERLQGTVTKLISNPAGQLMAVVLDSKDLVRFPASFRPQSPAAAVKAAKIGPGTRLTLAAVLEPKKAGQVSIYNRQVSVSALAVDGKKADSVTAAAMVQRGRGAQILKISVDPALDAAQAEGMVLYNPPLPPGSRIALRGLRGPAALRALGVEPLVDENKRPW